MQGMRRVGEEAGEGGDGAMAVGLVVAEGGVSRGGRGAEDIIEFSLALERKRTLRKRNRTHDTRVRCLRNHDRVSECEGCVVLLWRPATPWEAA